MTACLWNLLYFLSEDEGVAAGALAGAGVAAAAAGAAGAVVGAAPASPPPSLFAAVSGFTEPYPSAYQPPPFIEKAGAEMTRFNSPPQCGQVVISGSENF
jgi:hypothetical protein